jgi:proteasome lid subunit RPN8/RPN11
MEHEKGYSVCQSGKVTALVHNHPSGNINPSKKDMETAKQHNVKICVSVNRNGQTETKCYKPMDKK